MENREILFRGKLLHSQEWIEGNLIIAQNGQPYIIPFIIFEPDGHHLIIDSDNPFWVDTETVGQFCNLTDKNGKKIFGDDLRKWIHGDEEHVFRIYHIEGGFVIKAPAWMDNLNWSDSDRMICEHLSDPQTADWLINSTEHFGTIFDNPSLLKP